MGKFLAGLALVAAVSTSFASCTGMFTDGSRPSAEAPQTESESGNFLKSEDKGITSNVHVVNETPTSSGLVEVLDKARPSVVEIYVKLSNGTSAGSGVIVDLQDTDQNGKNDTAYIVTCHHVIEDALSTSVKSIYGVQFEASLIGSDPRSDVGVIKIRSENEEDLEGLTYSSWIADSDSLKVGTSVVAVGNPLGILGGTATTGIISAINRGVVIEGNKMTLLQTDAAINGGNSGGALFDATTGALVGIVNAGYESYAAEGLNFAIPANVAREVETELMSTYGGEYEFGYVEGNYSFGAEFRLVSRAVGWTSYRYYVAVSAIDSYGALAKEGIAAGDYIFSVTVNGKTLDLSTITANTVSDLTSFLSDTEYNVGDEVKINYARSSGSLKEYTAEFKIRQYVYGYDG
ncbi:MAG: trypsin-like peptidase domain-containing protein [Clostridia bacterium]|nr:trypsin-like peptidase domain-containing protein [Clostridia bacterium]